MSHEITAILVMLNNYLHDLAVGILFANVLLTLILMRCLREYGIAASDLSGKFIQLSSRITWGALAFIILGGIVRTLTYKDFEWAEAAGKGQVAALILKHIILVGCTVVGIVFQIRLSRRGHNTLEKGEDQRD
jgi:hypothetical protein